MMAMRRRMGPERVRPWLLVALALCGMLLAGPTAAQTDNRARDATGELMMFFYTDPQASRIVNLVKDYESISKSWDAYPPLAGFYAVVFRKFTAAQADSMIPDQLRPDTAEALRASLQLAGNPTIPKLQAKLNALPRDATLQQQFAGLPTAPEQIVVRIPTHLDLLWGASFASGDPKYPDRIIQFYAAVTDQSDKAGMLVIRLAAQMAGGPKVSPDEVRSNGDNEARQMIFAATALWALTANAKRHKFVDDSIGAYIRANPRKFSALGLAATTKRPMPQ